jgi:hypothetical protein
MLKASSGNMRYALVILVALVLVAYVALTFNEPTAPKIVELKDYSLNPDTINANSSSTLSFTIKNDDNSNSHFVTVHFNASSMLTFWQGSEILPTENGMQYLTRTFSPSDVITTSITVKATLPSQMSSGTYPIVLTFFVDGNQFDSKQVNLNVQG